jgi:acetyl-CoA carboxylase biotin carboxylase subunit
MFKRLLIANRGEPAVRVIRTCRELGIETVAVYSEIDAGTLAVRLADHAVCIGPAAAADSYLNVPRILSAAEITDSEAIHPGYDFLAENAEFVEAVEMVKLAFVGPGSETIRRLNDRLQVRAQARELGIPILPGSESEITSAADARQLAEQIGYPIVFKTARKSRKFWVVRKDKDLETALRMAQGEAKALLNDPRIYLERYLETARHLEVQFLADDAGITVFPERESSIQHRQENIMCEALSPLVTDANRARLAEWTTKFAQAIRYRNAGTLEFLADESGNLFLLNLQASLQREHAVTEVLVGCDLVAEQIRIAAGESPAGAHFAVRSPHCPLPHVIQCKISAENPEQDWMPTAGIVKLLRLPGGPGVRIDSHVYSGYEGSAEYDTLLARITVWDSDRDKAIARMERALRETSVEGVVTTLEFQQKILRLGAFRKGELSTTMVEREILGLRPSEQ